MEKTVVNTKSGKGNADGVVSELSAFFTVKPGHEQALRAAVQEFADVLRNSKPADVIKTGLRETRHVIFDNGTRLLWATAFDTDWDPYVDDALLVVGVEHFVNWVKHTNEFEKFEEWSKAAAGGTEALDPNSPKLQEILKKSSGGLKAILQSVQVPAACYFNFLSAQTMTQINKAEQLEEAFQQVLDDTAAQQALQQPALKPLLDQAAA